MTTKGMSGVGLALVSGGILLAYAGIKGTSPIDELKGILKGNAPDPLSKDSLFTGFKTDGDFGSGDFGSSDPGASSNAVLNAARKYLGKPYVWGATFANGAGGDCSGLVYRAMRDIGYDIGRFTTATILVNPKFRRVTGSPSAGDIVVWPGDHMGIVAGNGTMLNAPHTGAVVRYDNYANRRKPVFLRPVALGGTAGSSRTRSFAV